MNTTTQHVTVSAKIRPDQRAQLDAIAKSAGHGQISHLIRAAIEDFLSSENGQESLEGTGTARRLAKEAERMAALKVAPRVGSQRHAALTIFIERGAVGATADEVYRTLQARGFACKENGMARRVTDLLQGGMIRLQDVTSERTGDRRELDGTITRATPTGSRATVYVVTGAGMRANAESRDKG